MITGLDFRSLARENLIPMSICVVGKDSIAATFAAEIASRNIPVVLCGPSPEAMATMAAQRCPFPREPDLAATMERTLADGRLRAGTELPAAVAGSRLTIVVARLELDDAGRPDYRWLDRTTVQVGEGLARGGAVLYDGMLGIGDTRRRFGPMLERGTGLRMGRDFGLAFSPERSRPGHVLFDLRLRPKIVGAVDDKTRAGVMEFLQLWIESAVMGVESLEAAEYIPLVEAAARQVNAVLALEFAALARTHGLDVHAVMAALDGQTAFPVCCPTLLADGPEIAAATRLLGGAASDSSAEAPAAPLLRQSQRIHDDVIPRTLTRLEELGDTLDGKQVLVLAATDTGDAPAVDAAPGTPLAMLLSHLRRRGALPRLAAQLPDRGRDAFEVLVVVDPRIHLAALELETFPRCRLLLDGVNTFSARRIAAAGIRHVAP